MQNVIEFLKANGAVEAYLFGSRARDEQVGDSDWDLGIRFADDANGDLDRLSRLAILQVELRKLIGAPVDLVDLNQAHLTLLYEILWKGHCLFTDNEEQRIQRELGVRRRFEDYRAIQAFYTRALQERMNAGS